MGTNLQVNRRWNDDRKDHVWQDPDWQGWAKDGGQIFIDDDLLGFMRAEGAKTEGEEDALATKGKRAKRTVNKRRGVLEVTRAISTTPYAGDISFNAKSGEKGRTSLYGTEMHATRYQYGLALTPNRLRRKEHCLHALDGLANLGEVAGNHSRFLFDFSPESMILRLSHDPAPRILYCFQKDNGNIKAPEPVRKVEAKDLDPAELYIGGQIARLPEIQALKTKVCNPGIKEALAAFNEAVKSALGMKADHLEAQSQSSSRPRQQPPPGLSADPDGPGIACLCRPRRVGQPPPARRLRPGGGGSLRRPLLGRKPGFNQ